MNTVKEILDIKGGRVWTVTPDTTVFGALILMSEKNLGALLVTEGESIAGIFSERDYARKVALAGKHSRETLVKEIMSANIIYVDPSFSVEECMALMINKRIRHLPVLEGGKLAGLISIGDVVKAIIDQKEFMIEQLVHYISGRHA
jgi:CBS domain-containing protein